MAATPRSHARVRVEINTGAPSSPEGLLMLISAKRSVLSGNTSRMSGSCAAVSCTERCAWHAAHRFAAVSCTVDYPKARHRLRCHHGASTGRAVRVSADGQAGIAISCDNPYGSDVYWRSFWLGCFQLSVVSPAFAAELHWEVPEGCPDVHALEREAEQVLGEPLTNYPLNMVGSVTQSAGQLSLSLRITLPAQAETRERALQAASCQELLEAAAVALALAAAESGERAAPAALPQNTEPREPPPGAAPIEPQDSEPSKLEIGAAGTSVLGIFPQLGLGGELQLAWTTGWLRLGLAATWFPERSMQVNDDLKVSFGAYFAQLLWCGQHNLARTQLYACATASFGQMGAHLDRPSQPRTTSTPWRAVGIRLGLSYPILPPLELTASLALVAPFTRPRFYMQPASIVLHEPALLNAQLLLGVLFSL